MKPRKNEEVKARVDEAMKSDLWQLALARGLDVSDVVREALREFIRKNKQPAQIAA